MWRVFQLWLCLRCDGSVHGGLQALCSENDKNVRLVKFLEKEITSEGKGQVFFHRGMRGEKTPRSLGSMWAGLQKGGGYS
jgi:hypothetical protein